MTPLADRHLQLIWTAAGPPAPQMSVADTVSRSGHEGDDFFVSREGVGAFLIQLARSALCGPGRACLASFRGPRARQTARELTRSGGATKVYAGRGGFAWTLVLALVVRTYHVVLLVSEPSALEALAARLAGLEQLEIFSFPAGALDQVRQRIMRDPFHRVAHALDGGDAYFCVMTNEEQGRPEARELYASYGPRCPEELKRLLT